MFAAGNTMRNWATLREASLPERNGRIFPRISSAPCVWWARTSFLKNNNRYLWAASAEEAAQVFSGKLK